MDAGGVGEVARPERAELNNFTQLDQALAQLTGSLGVTDPRDS